MPGTLTVSGMAAGLVSGEKLIGPVTSTGNNLIGQIDDATLVAGDNTFAVPAGAVKVAVFLGSAPAVTVKVRTNLNALEAGLPIAPVSGTPWFAMDLTTGVTSIILNSSGSLPGIELTFI